MLERICRIHLKSTHNNNHANALHYYTIRLTPVRLFSMIYLKVVTTEQLETETNWPIETLKFDT